MFSFYSFFFLRVIHHDPRPENSLLAEDLEYDSAVRQAPVFTEDVARKLEDIIRFVFQIRTRLQEDGI